MKYLLNINNIIIFILPVLFSLFDVTNYCFASEPPEELYHWTSTAKYELMYRDFIEENKDNKPGEKPRYSIKRSRLIKPRQIVASILGGGRPGLFAFPNPIGGVVGGKLIARSGFKESLDWEEYLPSKDDFRAPVAVRIKLKPKSELKWVNANELKGKSPAEVDTYLAENKIQLVYHEAKVESGAIAFKEWIIIDASAVDKIDTDSKLLKTTLLEQKKRISDVLEAKEDLIIGTNKDGAPAIVGKDSKNVFLDKSEVHHEASAFSGYYTDKNKLRNLVSNIDRYLGEVERANPIIAPLSEEAIGEAKANSWKRLFDLDGVRSDLKHESAITKSPYPDVLKTASTESIRDVMKTCLSKSDFKGAMNVMEYAVGKSLSDEKNTQKKMDEVLNRLHEIIEADLKSSKNPDIDTKMVSIFGGCASQESGCLGSNAERIKQAFKTGTFEEKMFLLYKASLGYFQGIISNPSRVKEINKNLKIKLDPKYVVNSRNSFMYGDYANLTEVESARNHNRVLDRLNFEALNNNDKLLRPKGKLTIEFLQEQKESCEKDCDTKCKGIDNCKVCKGKCNSFKEVSGANYFDSYEKRNATLPEFFDSGENHGMPLKTGISGTTDRLMTMTYYLFSGSTEKERNEMLLHTRDGALGWMTLANDHSAHEILTSAKSFTTVPGFQEYKPGPRYYETIRPGSVELKNAIEKNYQKIANDLISGKLKSTTDVFSSAMDVEHSRGISKNGIFFKSFKLPDDILKSCLIEEEKRLPKRQPAQDECVDEPDSAIKSGSDLEEDLKGIFKKIE